MSKAGYIPMSFKRLGGRTRHPRVSPSPSKIPYGGFSPVRLQTGLPQRRSSPTAPALSARPASELVPPTYTPPPALHRTPVAPTGNVGGAIRQDVSSPEALGSPVWVLLSLRVSAYYGLICASRRLPPIYVLDGRPPPYGLVWAAVRGSPIYSAYLFPSCRLPYPGGLKRLLLTVASSLPLAFTTVTLARRPLRISMVLHPDS